MTPEKESYIDDKHLQDLNAQDKGFILEIRFPENRLEICLQKIGPVHNTRLADRVRLTNCIPFFSTVPIL